MGSIIDGRAWARQRMQFLKEQLDAGVSEQQRAAIEAELESLRRKAGFWSRRGMRRWLGHGGEL
jgi:hypothetical protein